MSLHFKRIATTQIIGVLKQLVMKEHVAIAATIHQPSTKVIQKFDALYILSPFGGCIYEVLLHDD